MMINSEKENKKRLQTLSVREIAYSRLIYICIVLFVTLSGTFCR